MNSYTEYEQFNFKYEEDPLSLTHRKTEPEDIKCEIKIEAKDSYVIPEHIDVKHEIEPIPYFVYPNKILSEVEDKEQSFVKLFEDCENESQAESKNTVEAETNVPVVYDSCEIYGTDLQEKKCEHEGERSNTCKVCNNSVFELSNSNTCVRTIDKNFNCDICNRSFPFRSYFIRHMNVHRGEKPFSCNYCNMTFSKKFYLGLHIRSHINENPFTCNICSKSFWDKSHLRDHKRIHTNEKPFVCDICSNSFRAKSHLTAHRRIHTNEKPFACNICKKSFRTKSYLSAHTRIHSNEKPFSCNICRLSFSQKFSLTRHTLSHTNEKPFMCNICSKSFSQKYYLTRHTYSHTNEKLFKCRICNMAFSKEIYLTRHTSTHTNEKQSENCDMCKNGHIERKVNTSDCDSSLVEYTNHSISNQNSKTLSCEPFSKKCNFIKQMYKKCFTCSLCSKSFSQKYHLIEHIRIHTNEKPFVCNICNRSFSQKSHLTKHTHIHTKENQ